MTLKQLEAFYWAATCASFAVAAQRLHLSLSSLSKRIAELEESLEQPLFDRSGHRAALTDAGTRLLPRAHELLRAADDLRVEVGQGAGLPPVCRFGVGELSALTWLPALVRRVRQAHPALRLEISVDIGEVLERRVADGELDFAVIAGRSSRSMVASQPIAQAGFVWCAAAPVAGPARLLKPSLLAQWPLVTLPAGAGTTRILDDWLAGQGARVSQRIVCDHWGAVAGMLIDGVGVGLLPQGWAESLQQRGQLKILAARPGLAPLAYAYQWRRDDSRPLVSCMKEHVRACADFSAASRIF